MNAASFLKVPLGVGFGSLLLQALTALAADSVELIPTTPARDMVLWYRQPAEKWLEAMPLGNGLMGAIVFGGIRQERIALNESTFWSGRPHDYDNPEALRYFPQIRDLVFAGKFQEAERMADTNFYGRPAAQQAFQPLGDLLLTVDGVEQAEDYRRELDMETGVAKIAFRVGDARFTREVFVSYLQEWIEDWRPGGQGHNMSPNFTFYPGSSITIQSASELVTATRKRMEGRRSRGGWPLAWDLCMWARLERGDQVASCLQTLVRSSLAPNLHNSGSNQSDASFSLTAGVAEALIQSHAGEINLLPALPPHWRDGSVSGLRARGGFEVRMAWKDGKIQSAEIRNDRAADCKVRCGTKTAALSLKRGKVTQLNADLAVTQ